MLVTPKPLGRSEGGAVPNSEVRSQTIGLLRVRWIGMDQAGRGSCMDIEGRILQQKQGVGAGEGLGLCVLHPDSICKFIV